jgi:hypothetical protein
MNDLKKELKERKKDLEEKIMTDTSIYGKPLGNKQLRDKIDATKRKIIRHQESIDKLQTKIDARNAKKHKLSTWDNRVLDAIRGKSSVHNTSSENTYRYDQRFRGSGSSRRQAKRYFRS